MFKVNTLHTFSSVSIIDFQQLNDSWSGSPKIKAYSHSSIMKVNDIFMTLIIVYEG